MTLRANTGFPAEHHNVTNIWEPWKEMVEEETDGRVTIELYHGGTLGELSSSLGDVAGGVYDLGNVPPSYFADSGMFPLTLPALAFAYPDVECVNLGVVPAWYEEFRDQITVEGVEIIGNSVADPYHLFSTSPIDEISDLKGMKLKAQGEADAGLTKAWGAEPVALTTGEVYQALERGTVDAAPYTQVGVLGTKFYEVAPYMTKLAMAGTIVSPVMSTQALESLPPDLQSAFEDDLIPGIAELAQKDFLESIQETEEKLPGLLEEHGGGMIELPEDELVKFREPAKEQWNSWVKQANEKGFDGQAMVDHWLSLLEEHCGGYQPF